MSEHGAGDWKSIGRLMGGRTGDQCFTRWTRTLNPGIKRGALLSEYSAQKEPNNRDDVNFIESKGT